MKSIKWFVLAVIMLIVDQVTKQLIVSKIVLGDKVPIFPGFNLTHQVNPGAAFSFLADAGGWQRWFFTVLAMIVSVVIAVWIYRLKDNEKWTAASLALILSGAIGNLWDRIAYGHVIDFLGVYWGESHWPAFNVADSAISIGVAIMLIVTFKDGFSQKTVE